MMERKLKRVIINNVKKQQPQLPNLNDELDERAIVKQVKETLAQFTDKHKKGSIDLQRKAIFIIIMIFMWIFIIIIFAISISTAYSPLRFAY